VTACFPSRWFLTVAATPAPHAGCQPTPPLLPSEGHARRRGVRLNKRRGSRAYLCGVNSLTAEAPATPPSFTKRTSTEGFTGKIYIRGQNNTQVCVDFAGMFRQTGDNTHEEEGEGKAHVGSSQY